MSERKYLKDVSRLHPKDLRFLSAPVKPKTPLPSSVDLRHKMPPVYDQQTIGSCVANALVAAYEYLTPGFMGSRLFLYYNERKMENDVNEDAGAIASDGIKALEHLGICAETEWPYDITKFAVAPPAHCYTDALKHKVVKAHNVHPDLTSLKQTLASQFPVVVGIQVYESFESDTVAKTGIVPMPSSDEKCLGGHEILLIGYQDDKQQWICRNSWSGSWGDQGYFYLPYAYLLDSNLSSDFWIITKDTN
jgi:C1A family cysteine protease